MGRIIASLFVFVSIAPHAPALQARPEAAASQAAVRACSLLTKELVLKVTPKKDTSMAFIVPAQEEAVGAGGSACEYGGIGLQIDPFTPERLETLRKSTGQSWAPVAGVGDSAYFRENGTSYAELYVTVGTHTMTIQMSVPTGNTPAAIKPNTIALANALVPKLR